MSDIKNSILDMWVAEYSHNQKSYHVDTLGNVLQHNINIVKKDNGCDYIPFCICTDIEEAHKACDMMRDYKGENI